MKEVFILWEEVSDQYGTDKIVCVCMTEEIAKREQIKITNHRSFIQKVNCVEM
jgi:hypothetical protein